MYSVYALYNQRHDKVYVGQTNDLIERLKIHNQHGFDRSYTSRFDGEWKLIYSEECPDRRSALFREKQLKSFKGREFVRKHIPL